MAFIDDQEEIKRIRESYEIKEVEKTGLDELKELDQKVKAPAKIFAYTYGSVGALVLGTGMSLAMGVIGASIPLGIIIGLVGIAMVSTTNFIHNKILDARKAKYRDQILTKSASLTSTPVCEAYVSSQRAQEAEVSYDSHDNVQQGGYASEDKGKE